MTKLWSMPRKKQVGSKPKLSYRPWVESLESRTLLSGDAVLRWNALGAEASKIDHGIGFPSQEFGPTRASRAFAIEMVAIYDAVAAIDGTYKPFLTTVTAAPGTSMAAAIDQAGHDTLVALYSNQKAMFDQALAQDLAVIPDGLAKSEGIALGRQTASNTLAARANDGSQKDAPGQPVTYTYGQQPGQWRADPLHLQATPLTPDWGSVTPFELQSGSQFRAPPPPALDSPQYTAAFTEVKILGGSSPTSPTTRSDEQTAIGLFWGYDAQPGLCAPTRFYNQIAETIAIQQNNTEVENARLFMLVNVAMADAGITVWETKYHYNFWRPITAIRESDPGTGPTGLGDGNPDTIGDPNWTPLGAPADNNNGTNFTPPFPGYTSGHAGFGGALFRILADFYGRDDIHFTIVSDEFNTITIDQNGKPRPLRPRSYTSFSQAAEENGESRIYLGIHFNFDKVEGIKQGNEIADYIFARVGQRVMNANEAFINKLYRDLLGRRAEPGGMAYWENLMNQGATRTQIAAGIESSLESHTIEVAELYARLLHRLPDTAGLDGFVSFLAQGGTLQQVEEAVLGSAEYYSSRGGNTNDGFLKAIYSDILNRLPDAFGASSFSQALSLGTSTTAVASTILTSPEARQDEMQAMYQQFLHRAPDLTGFNVFCNALFAGVPHAMLEAVMLGSDEYNNHI